MLKTSFIAVGMIAASVAMASAGTSNSRGWNHGGSSYGYDNGTSALSRYCPRGQYPHSWPGGWRCQYANGDFSGAGRW